MADIETHVIQAREEERTAGLQKNTTKTVSAAKSPPQKPKPSIDTKPVYDKPIPPPAQTTRVVHVPDVPRPTATTPPIAERVTAQQEPLLSDHTTRRAETVPNAPVRPTEFKRTVSLIMDETPGATVRLSANIGESVTLEPVAVCSDIPVAVEAEETPAADLFGANETAHLYQTDTLLPETDIIYQDMLSGLGELPAVPDPAPPEPIQLQHEPVMIELVSRLQSLEPAQAEKAQLLLESIMALVPETQTSVVEIDKEVATSTDELEILCEQLFETLNLTVDAETIKQLVIAMVTTEVPITEEQASVPLSDIVSLNARGTREYKSAKLAALASAVAHFAKQKARPHLTLGKYTLQACLA